MSVTAGLLRGTGRLALQGPYPLPAALPTPKAKPHWAGHLSQAQRQLRTQLGDLRRVTAKLPRSQGCQATATTGQSPSSAVQQAAAAATCCQEKIVECSPSSSLHMKVLGGLGDQACVLRVVANGSDGQSGSANSGRGCARRHAQQAILKPNKRHPDAKQELAGRLNEVSVAPASQKQFLSLNAA